jgi:hypothetical protein
MDTGVVVVFGVSANVVVEDISFSVPMGKAIPIPGDLAHTSKDLWRLISQGVLFKCDVSNVVSKSQVVQVSQPKNDGVVEELQRELAACREQNSVLASNLKKAQGDVERLTAELAEEKSKASKLEKLDDILSILQKQGTSRVIISDSPTLSAVEDDAPRYIPSQIKSEASVEGSTEVVEEVQSEDSSVSKASQALRKARRNS